MKAALYARVSIGDLKPENQIIALKRYCKSRKYKIYKIYIDKISGVTSSRPELNKMMKAAYENKFDAVLVWKLDRLGRSLKHLITVLENLNHWKIGLVSTTQNIDTSTSIGKFFFHLIGAFAEMEREIISERTKAGLERAKQQGKRLGRPKGIKDSKKRKRKWKKKPVNNGYEF